MTIAKTALSLAVLLVLAGCAKSGEIDESGGITAIRSACPAAAIPAYTGDVTLFDPVDSRDARAIDIVANITNLRPACSDNGTALYTEATFEVQASRRDATAARQVTLPYFATVVRAGSNVVAKRVSTVTIDFAPGAYRAFAVAKGASYVDKDAATLPADIQKRISGKRKAGDADAAIDPLAAPDVKAALQRTSFELLIGFNLTQDQLKYNVTR